MGVSRRIVVLFAIVGVCSMSTWAADPAGDSGCTELQALVVQLSKTDIAPTRQPLVRDEMPERDYVWCLGIGFAQLEGEGRGAKAVMLSFGREPDGSLWLDLWEKRDEPSFKWKQEWERAR